MDKVVRTLLSLTEVKSGHDDDFCDRLSRQVTSSMLVIFALIVTTKQFVGEPISCWCPAHFTDSHRHYTNSICWISNTFYVPFDVRIPDIIDAEWKSRQMVGYYQWVPLILLSMALLAFAPMLIWRFLSLRSGIDVSSLMESAATSQRAGYAELRERTIRYIVNQIDRYLMAQRDRRRDGCCSRCKQTLARYCLLVGGKRHGNYLTLSYLFVKLLYLANAVGQLFLLEYFLGIDYTIYGFQAIARALRGEEWRLSDSFPRVTLCAFQIRHQARVHDYVVQCALSINLFNEKIFLVIWFWYALVSLATLYSLVQWTARALYWPSQLLFVRRSLRDFEVTQTSKTALTKFVEYYLRRDGLFLIRLVSINVGEIVAAETMAGLWDNYSPDKRQLSEVICSGGGSGGGVGGDPTAPRRSRHNAVRGRTGGKSSCSNSLGMAGPSHPVYRDVV